LRTSRSAARLSSTLKKVGVERQQDQVSTLSAIRIIDSYEP